MKNEENQISYFCQFCVGTDETFVLEVIYIFKPSVLPVLKSWWVKLIQKF